MIDRRPALIVRGTRVDDVVAAIRFAREHGLVVTARGGGHGVAGNALTDGGLVVDLSLMKGISVDPEARTARAEAGVTLGELDAATQAFGLATPLGVVSATGIAGLTLSGGIGWLRRKHGLSADNLVSLQVVTADGSVLTASETENSELFWALRGEAGASASSPRSSTGCIRSAPTSSSRSSSTRARARSDVLRAVAEFTAAAPDEVSPLAFLGRVPHADPFPAEAHGDPYVAVAALYIGPWRKARPRSRRSASSASRSST